MRYEDGNDTVSWPWPDSSFCDDYQRQKILEKKGLAFTEEIWNDDPGCADTPWTVLTIPEHMMLFFSTKGHLWKITSYAYALRLGEHLITPGMALADVEAIDPGLHFDDWWEIYFSPNGYWIDDTQTGNTSEQSAFTRPASSTTISTSIISDDFGEVRPLDE